MRHVIRQYRLEQGALEVQYMEEYFGEFRKKKNADEIIQRLKDREHLILLSMSPALDEDGLMIPVAFKVGHELRLAESDPQLLDLVSQLRDCVRFDGRKVFYSWIGGTRKEWRGGGHYRALTEQQEEWAHRRGFDELVVKTKNRFYAMRATLDRLHFDIIKFQPNRFDNGEAKVYLSKDISSHTLEKHQTIRSVVEVA